MSAILKSVHEKRITVIESVAMKVWLQRVLQGDLRGGAAALDKGLAFEHYEALLANDQSQNTPEENEELRVRREAFEKEVGQRMEEMIADFDQRQLDDRDLR